MVFIAYLGGSWFFGAFLAEAFFSFSLLEARSSLLGCACFLADFCFLAA
jgi:hypothetical protein